MENYSTKSVLLIYTYYSRPNEQKNETNLSFFLKYGLDTNRWRKNVKITTLIVLNKSISEVLIPRREDIHVLKADTDSDWGGWKKGIEYIQNIFKKPIYDVFDYLSLVNASAFGPVYENTGNCHWLDPFFNKLEEENSVICCPCSNILPQSDLGGPGRRVSPIFSLIKISEKILDLLISENISSYSNGTSGSWYNTVLGNKMNKVDAVLTGEYGLSRILLDNNLKISSLVEGKTDKTRIDFFSLDNSELKKSIFLKNVWRWEHSYASQPVLYNFCIDFMNNKLNYINEFKNYEDLFDYKKLDRKNGKILYNDMFSVKKGPTTFWRNNREFYDKFGRAEEHFLFPKIKKNNSVVIYAHYDKDNIIKDYVLNSLKILMLLEYDIMFYTASEKITNISQIKMPFKINYFKNQFAGTDWLIWRHGLTLAKNYENILLINDSLILGINGIENMRNSIKKMRSQNFDLWGHWSSSDISYHYVGTPVELKGTSIDLLLDFMNRVLPKCKKRMDYVKKLETKLVLFFQSRKLKTGVILEEKKILSSSEVTNLYFVNPYSLNNWINNKNAFAIKWKYMLPFLLYKNIQHPFFNYLLRYLHTDEYNLFDSPMESAPGVPSQIDFKLSDWCYSIECPNKMEKYNLYTVYFINCTLNKNYYVWLQKQIKYITDQVTDKYIKELNKFRMYILAVVKKGTEKDFTDKINNLYPKSLFEISFFYENEYEYQALKKIHDLGKVHSKKNDIILYYHSKNISRCKKCIQNKYDVVIKDIRKIFDIFSHNPEIDKIGYSCGGNGWIWYNFWYARGSYINFVEEPIKTSRAHYYEDWLGRIVENKKDIITHEERPLSFYKNTLKSCYCLHSYENIPNTGFKYDPSSGKYLRF